ncbi:hypothetical protein EUGRSUZ_L03534 [Eucalyptus grandis]|uniref:Uncharacterized protein n=1 Tax=Eucalyptus grandis TaxID=71139 RepID=A0AAD9WHQ2_EUCGR|nr:hypothetical protein EUGRSUZ_L03534 [Eucalyptus grandis]
MPELDLKVCVGNIRSRRVVSSVAVVAPFFDRADGGVCRNLRLGLGLAVRGKVWLHREEASEGKGVPATAEVVGRDSPSTRRAAGECSVKGGESSRKKEEDWRREEKKNNAEKVKKNGEIANKNGFGPVENARGRRSPREKRKS